MGGEGGGWSTLIAKRDRNKKEKRRKKKKNKGRGASHRGQVECKENFAVGNIVEGGFKKKKSRATSNKKREGKKGRVDKPTSASRSMLGT